MYHLPWPPPSYLPSIYLPPSYSSSLNSYPNKRFQYSYSIITPKYHSTPNVLFNYASIFLLFSTLLPVNATPIHLVTFSSLNSDPNKLVQHNCFIFTPKYHPTPNILFIYTSIVPLVLHTPACQGQPIHLVTLLLPPFIFLLFRHLIPIHRYIGCHPSSLLHSRIPFYPSILRRLSEQTHSSFVTFVYPFIFPFLCHLIHASFREYLSTLTYPTFLLSLLAVGPSQSVLGYQVMK